MGNNEGFTTFNKSKSFPMINSKEQFTYKLTKYYIFSKGIDFVLNKE